jgi:hypothetical protein
MMRTHPYLRAYMAGVVVPTILLLVMVSVFATLRFKVFPLVPTPGEPTLGTALLFEAIGRAIIFPMAIVPNLWGLWNMLYLAIDGKAKLSLGLFGALLPILIVPFGLTLAYALGIFRFQLEWVIPFAATAMVAYYLVWKHAVGFLNAEVGIG